MKKTAFMLFGLLGLTPLLRSEPAKPNILIIYTDDLDFDELGVFDPVAYPTITASQAASRDPVKENRRYVKPLTPNMDKLVGASMLFSQMRMVTTVCTPARYALLTGQHCSRSKTLQEKHPVSGPACVEFNTDILPGQWHLGRALHDAGYFTGIVGKWHLSGVRRGPGFINPPICDYTGKPVDNQNQDPSDPETAGKIRKAYEAGIQYLKEKEGFDFASSIYMGNANELGLPKSLYEHESNMEWFTAGVVKFLEEQKDSKKPFFLYFAPNIPHGGGGEKFAKADPRATPEGLVDWHLGIQPSREDVLRRTRAAGVHEAWATWLDDGVGVILKKLDDLGLARNTIIIFSSDQQSRGKWTCYEAARVPFTVRWPGHVKEGSQCDQSLASVDMVPTILELCGVKLPPNTEAIIDGRSFAPCLTGGHVTERSVLIEMGFGRAIVDNGWKYIALRFPEKMEQEIQAMRDQGKPLQSYISPHRNELGKHGGEMPPEFPSLADPDQLYNLKDDMLEQHNLANDPRYADKLAEMKKLLAASLAPLPHAFGEFKPTGRSNPEPTPKP